MKIEQMDSRSLRGDMVVNEVRQDDEPQPIEKDQQD